MSLESMRHSLAHILAMAVKKLYPNTRLGIGPAIKDGFYYDFDDLEIEEKDLKKIEKEMKRIISQNIEFKEEIISKSDAKQMFKKEPYKLDLLKELDAKVSVYNSGNFVDLCAGPHVKSTKEIGAFKLTKIAGAYWKGESNNKMLTRIYGVAFKTQEQLEKHLKILEEAEKRNHIKLGKELDLFTFHPESPGSAFFHPKGLVIWDELLKYWNEEHEKEGYVLVRTPIILNKSLWETSGHWDYYKENMYDLKVDEEDFAIKPMNCPGGILMYKEDLHSYRELPLKVGEIGLVHRHELRGVLNGLFRVRSFFQDDAHIYCTEKQATNEVVEVIKLTDRIYKAFGLKYVMELSTKPDKSIGTDEMWDNAEKALKSALKKVNKKYELNPGDGAFYGPKIDFHIKDALNRTWQCGTIQFDFSLPERFKLTYEGEDGKKHRPVMIHRTIYGGIERFYGVLVEHFGGQFPPWLAPTQVVLTPVSDKHNKFSTDIADQMKEAGLRVEVDDRSESIGKKVRDNVVKKIPYIITIGDKEIKNKTLAVRDQKGKVKFGVKVDSFIKELTEIIQNRKQI